MGVITIYTTVSVCDENDEETVYDAKAVVFTGGPGRYYGPPEGCHPPEPAEVSKIELTLRGKPVSLDTFSVAQEESIYNQILEAYENDDVDDYLDPDDLPHQPHDLD